LIYPNGCEIIFIIELFLQVQQSLCASLAVGRSGCATSRRKAAATSHKQSVEQNRKNLGRASMPAVKKKIIDNINVSRYHEL